MLSPINFSKIKEGYRAAGRHFGKTRFLFQSALACCLLLGAQLLVEVGKGAEKKIRFLFLFASTRGKVGEDRKHFEENSGARL